MPSQPLKEEVIFKGVYSKQKAKGHNIYLRFIVLTLALTTMSFVVVDLTRFSYPLWLPAVLAACSAIYYYAKERRWTIQVVDRVDRKGKVVRVLEVIHHRHALNAMLWFPEVKSNELSTSSLRLFKQNGEYSLLHRASSESYPMVTVRSRYRKAFKAYSREFIDAVYTLDSTR